MNNSSPQKSSVLNKIDVSEIKNGAMLMRNGSLCGILMVSSVNFALKSIKEQDAIVFRYQEFLNSLDFPIQILLVNRKFDVSGYLTILEEKKIAQENELLRIQTGEYIDFVKGLTQVVNVMSSFFYVVVPYSQTEGQKAAGLFGKMLKGFQKKGKEAKEAEAQSLEQMRSGLWQRMEYISSILAACGLKTVALNDDELLELLYKMYNPEAKEKPKLIA